MVFHGFTEVDCTWHRQTSVSGSGKGEEPGPIDPLAESYTASVHEDEPPLISPYHIAIGPAEAEEVQTHLLETGRTGLDLRLIARENVEGQILPFLLGNAVTDARIVRRPRGRFTTRQHWQCSNGSQEEQTHQPSPGNWQSRS